ncbi:MAG: circularly permuted type 2 ATP-grasp protein [Myxococcales bacterium]|nr:circularly permuted type 2 ATP-grasp protein [Myxococcales bacterium]
MELPPDSLLAQYKPLPDAYDELVDGQGRPREHAEVAVRLLGGLSPEAFRQRQDLAELSLINQGVTFSVYSDNRGTEKIFPFCIVPRVIAGREWAEVEKGLKQRMAALELFLADIYGDQRILKEGVIPRAMVTGSKSFIPQLCGVHPPKNVRIHIAGVDLIRDPQGTFRVLEDNLRTPSGVSYVLENRVVTKRVFQHALERLGVRQVDEYPTQLAKTLRSVAPGSDPTAVLLTPGPFNSAYFEHTFLSRTMGVELVEASDLFVDDDKVYVRTTYGPQRVHVIYRRTDDAFLDPAFFRPDSMLGVRGLMKAYIKGNVALVNAPGNGVADDKAIYPYVPDMIKFYLGESSLLEQVPTYKCIAEDDRQYVLEHLGELVVKAVDEAGGYGMLMGPQSTRTEREEFRRRIQAEPRKYIAQHRVELSTCPTWDSDRHTLGARRVDLRPFILTGAVQGGLGFESWVLPGGLTRVALREGSYVVNSSQGGGSKDTWVQKDMP